MKDPTAMQALQQHHDGGVAGWVIGMKIGDDPVSWQMFAVAEPIQQKAYELLQAALTTRTGDEVMELAGPISKRTVAELKLAEGEYRVIS